MSIDIAADSHSALLASPSPVLHASPPAAPVKARPPWEEEELSDEALDAVFSSPDDNPTAFERGILSAVFPSPPPTPPRSGSPPRRSPEPGADSAATAPCASKSASKASTPASRRWRMGAAAVAAVVAVPPTPQWGDPEAAGLEAAGSEAAASEAAGLEVAGREAAGLEAAGREAAGREAAASEAAGLEAADREAAGRARRVSVRGSLRSDPTADEQPAPAMTGGKLALSPPPRSKSHGCLPPKCNQVQSSAIKCNQVQSSAIKSHGCLPPAGSLLTATGTDAERRATRASRSSVESAVPSVAATEATTAAFVKAHKKTYGAGGDVSKAQSLERRLDGLRLKSLDQFEKMLDDAIGLSDAKNRPSVQSLRQAMKHKLDRVIDLFRKIDVDESGAIDRQEFETGLLSIVGLGEGGADGKVCARAALAFHGLPLPSAGLPRPTMAFHWPSAGLPPPSTAFRWPSMAFRCFPLTFH